MLSAETEALLNDYGAILHRGYPRWMRPFLLRDVVGLTLGRHIFIEADYAGDADALVRHELMHVRQVARLGLPRFLFRYATEWLGAMLHGSTTAAAYTDLSFEIEARRAETDPSVLGPPPQSNAGRRGTIMAPQENPPPGAGGPLE